MKLREDKTTFTTLVSSAAQYMVLPEVYIEKDYWVTLALKYLSASDVKQQTVFKGGTSLSKAYGLIQRFSEDIDLAAIAPDLGDSQRKALLKKVERVTATGLTSINDGRTSKGSKFRKTVYQYPRNIDSTQFGQASPELLIEVNTFTTPEPHEAKLIQTMIADCVVAQNRQDLIEQYQLHAFDLNVLSPRRTLVEKLLGIIKDSYDEQPTDRMGKRIRHLYDVCMILREKQYRQFAESDDFKMLCQQCIDDEISSWGKEQSIVLQQPLADAPLFENLNDWWPALTRIYKGDFADLVYGELPDETEISKTFNFLCKQLKCFK